MRKGFTLLTILLQSTMLSAQDKNYAEWYLQREDVEIFVMEYGKGKDTVIVVHGGFGTNHQYMLDALDGLDDTFHFVLYDQRGSLLSPAASEDLTFQKNVDDLFALTQSLKLRKVKLFCHSMGTLVGMEFTKQHPEMVTNLVLAGSVPLKSDSLQSVFSRRFEEQIAMLEQRNEVMELLGPYREKGIDTLKSVGDIERSALSQRELTEYWRITFASVNIFDVTKHHLLKGGRAYYKPSASVMVETVDWKYDYRSVLNASAATTVINGDHDFFDFGGELFGQQLKAYERIELKILPTAGHNSWIDTPSLFRNYLKAALIRH